MIKKILCVITAISILGISGCELYSKATETSPTTTPASVRIIREAEINNIWNVIQMEIDLETPASIVLTLKDGDKVDGYFYLMKGDNINFSIAGVSPIYTSQSSDPDTKNITSDRFSFTANQGQGVAYTLILSPGTSDETNGKNSDVTVFLEITYPITGSLFVPLGTK